MPAPLFNHLLPVPASHRDIDNQWQLEKLATSVNDFKTYSAELLDLQQEAAAENLNRLSAIAEFQEEANELSKLANQNLESLVQLSASTLDTVRQGFTTIAARMLDQKRLLEESVTVLRRPYDTQVKELLLEADRALDAAVRTTGKDREAEFADAMKLVAAALANPIGSRDCVAWFQHGYLLWQFKAKPDEAETSFYHASRLSKDKAELYHVQSVRHLAHMQYLQAKYGDACKTISSALALSADYEVIKEAARYAARAGHEDTLTHLEQCIALRPETIITMFAEPDFAVLNAEMLHLATRMTSEARLAATVSVRQWQNAVAWAVETERRTGCALEAVNADELDRFALIVGTVDYISARALVERAKDATREILALAATTLEVQAETLRQRLAGLRGRATQAQTRLKTLKESQTQVFRPPSDTPRSLFSWWKTRAELAEQERRWEAHKATAVKEAQETLETLPDLERSAEAELRGVLEALDWLHHQVV